MTTTVRPRAPRRRDKTNAWTAAKILIFASFVALGAAGYIAWKPVVNPDVQDCGSPIGFFVHDRDNVVIHPGEPAAPPNAVALASQPSCRDLAFVEIQKAALGAVTFMGLLLAGILIGLFDDRIAYLRAPRFESLLRDMPRDSRVRHGLIPNVDVDELGVKLPPLESPEIAGLVFFGLVTFVAFPFAAPFDLARSAAATITLAPVLLGLLAAGVIVLTAAIQRGVVYPPGESLWTTFEVALATTWVGRLRPLVGTFGIDIHHLRRAGCSRDDAVVDVQVLQTVSVVVHVVLVVAVAFAVWAAPRPELHFDTPQYVLTGFVAVLLLSGVSRFAKKWRGLPVRPGLSGIKGLPLVASTPARLAELLGGTVAMSLCHGIVVVLALAAFDTSVPFTQVLFVLLAGVTLGALSPTPHGVGVIEGTMVLLFFGLGMDPGIAVCATLTYRTITFWLPMLPAWRAAKGLEAAGRL